MPPATSRDDTTAMPIRPLHLWRGALLCIALAHERQHPALAVLLLVPLNHPFFNLTTGLDRTSGGGRRGPAGGGGGFGLIAPPPPGGAAGSAAPPAPAPARRGG